MIYETMHPSSLTLGYEDWTCEKQALRGGAAPPIIDFAPSLRLGLIVHKGADLAITEAACRREFDEFMARVRELLSY